MGNKVICPRCEEVGYLVFETRKKNTPISHRHRNKKHKEYDSLNRPRLPYASIIHRVKKNGKWTNISHYLGKITNIDSNLQHLKTTLNSKISDQVWNAFKKSIDEARYNQFKDLDNPTNQVIAEIIALRKIPSVRFHDNIENQDDNPYHCPSCNEVIELVIRGYKISLKALDTADSL